MNSKKISRKIFYSFQKIIEKIKGVDFVSDIASRKEDHVEYVASTPFIYGILTNYFTEMNVNENDAIMDVGCGKGRMISCFATQPFGKVGGVEYEEDIFSICVCNMRKLKIYRVSLYRADASAFEGYDGYNYFYIFNPFHNKIMQGFIDRLKDSKIRKPRIIRVLYLNPVDKEMFVNSGFEIEKQLQHGIVVLRI